jgi:hypothetical protein
MTTSDSVGGGVTVASGELCGGRMVSLDMGVS